MFDLRSLTGVLPNLNGGLGGILDPVGSVVDGLTDTVKVPGIGAKPADPLGTAGQLLAGDSAVGGLLGNLGGSVGALFSGLGAAAEATGRGLGDMLSGTTGSGGPGGPGGSTSVTIITLPGGTQVTGTAGHDFLQGGAGNDKLFGAGGDDIIDGSGGYDIAIYQGSHADYTLTDAAGVTTLLDSVKGRDGSDTLRNVEFLQFKDGGLDIASKTFVSQAILNQIAQGYQAIARADPATGIAESVGTAIVQEKFSFDAYLKALVQDSSHSTVPALIIAGLINGTVPTAEKLDALSAFAQGQYDYYSTVLGSGWPQLGPYEALGRSFSNTAEFLGKYGAGTDSAFISEAYRDIFGRSATEPQKAALLAQVSYFEALYQAAGLSPVQADIQARGAVFGQIAGYAAADPAGPYFARAEDILVGLAKGDADYYGTAFS